MVFGWFRKNTGRQIKAECEEFRKSERDRIFAAVSERQPVDGLKFEALAYREPGVVEKKLFTFDASCERVTLIGMRHPLPAEFFGFMIAGLEGKLDDSQNQVYTDMCARYGEWCDLVTKPENGTLYCYEHPRIVVWVQDAYDCSKMIFAREKQFPLNGLPLKQYISIKDVAKRSPLLVQYFWSRLLDELPSEVQNNASLWLHDKAWPVGRGSYGNGYDVNAYDYYGRASRGVDEQKFS